MERLTPIASLNDGDPACVRGAVFTEPGELFVAPFARIECSYYSCVVVTRLRARLDDGSEHAEIACSQLGPGAW